MTVITDNLGILHNLELSAQWLGHHVAEMQSEV